MKNFIDGLNRITDLGYDFNYQLDDVAGYDLVFIDYNNGTDDIVRNANLFKSVLAWVNKEKALGGSSQQNVVMGISMGGLVARYALADLTKNNIATQTRLLITHDSPHQGANVPVGLQRVVLAVGELNMFGKKITDVFPDYSETTTVLNAPATSQLLTYRVANHDGPLILNSWLNATYKPMVTFQSTDPVPSYRFIATSQGSECGTPLFAPGTQLLNVQGSGAALTILVPGLYGKLEADIQAHALPALGSSGQIAKVKIIAKIYYLFIRLKKTGMDYSVSVSGTILPIDGTSGGTSPIGALDIAPQSISGGIGLIVANYGLSTSATTLSNFCFVPTASALDVQTYNNASLSATYVGGWSPLNPSSAETFIAQQAVSGSFNESHTRFTARNSEWLFDEMEGISNTLNCSSNCQTATNFSISGVSQFCDNATYSIPNLPSGATVTWTVSPSWSRTITIANNELTLSRFIEVEMERSGPFQNDDHVEPLIYLTAGGNYTITAYLESACGNLTFAKNVVFGSLKPGTIQWQWNFPPNRVHLYVPTVPNATSYKWYLGGVLKATTTSSYYDLPIVGNVSCGSSYVFGVKAISACGESEESYIYATMPECESFFVYYPNPANENVTISQKSTDAQAKSETASRDLTLPFEIKLYDEKAKIFIQSKSNTGDDLILNTQRIPNGTYFLHIFQGREVIKKQIIIRH